MITGNDKKSLRVLELLNQGCKHQEVVEELKISLDNVKRLSRYNKLLKISEKHLVEPAVGKIKVLGLKVLVLAQYFKNKEYELLNDILIQIEENITRDELKSLPKKIIARKNKLEQVTLATEKELEELEEKEAEVEMEYAQYMKAKKKLDKEVGFLNACSKKVKEFWIEHLGRNAEDIVLLKRLNFEWQQELKNRETIEYSRSKKVWIIKDIDGLLESTEERISENKKIYWSDLDYPWHYNYPIPYEAEYKYAEEVAVILKSIFDEQEQIYKKIIKERKYIQSRIKNLKKQGVQSFIHAKEYSNHFSDLEIIKHGKLEHEAMKYLYSKGYVAANEIVLSNKKRIDVGGFSRNEDIVIIEAKASMVDFTGDRKWVSYLEYSNEFYFIFGSWDYSESKVMKRIEGYKVGILLFNDEKKMIEVLKVPDKKHIEKERKEKFMFDITRRASQKVVLGF